MDLAAVSVTYSCEIWEQLLPALLHNGHERTFKWSYRWNHELKVQTYIKQISWDAKSICFNPFTWCCNTSRQGRRVVVSNCLHGWCDSAHSGSGKCVYHFTPLTQRTAQDLVLITAYLCLHVWSLALNVCIVQCIELFQCFTSFTTAEKQAFSFLLFLAKICHYIDFILYRSKWAHIVFYCIINHVSWFAYCCQNIPFRSYFAWLLLADHRPYELQTAGNWVCWVSIKLAWGC